MPLIARLESVSKLYGTFAALKQVTIEFERGCCYVLLGENGAGKSTLLRVLAGLLQPTFGHAFIFDGAGEGALTSTNRSPAPLAAGELATGQFAARDHQPEGRQPQDQRRRIGYMSHAPMMYDELSAAENLRYFAGLYREQACLTPEQALRAVGLDPALERPFGQYSQGMRQRASLARVLISQPELLLLDEPFSNMDRGSAGKMVALLAQLRSEGRSILLTTHQRELAAPLADYFVTLEEGRLRSLEPGPEQQVTAATRSEIGLGSRPGIAPGSVTRSEP